MHQVSGLQVGGERGFRDGPMGSGSFLRAWKGRGKKGGAEQSSSQWQTRKLSFLVKNKIE